MKPILFILLAFLIAGPGDGKKKGRQGNSLYAQEQYEEAAAMYREGIASVQDGGPGAVYSGLLNNLGAALYRSGDAEQAGIAFSSAASMALDTEDLVRASYNAGNAAYQTQQLEQSLEHYRRALLNDPSNQDAKFNYEFVKRQLEEQQQQQDQENQENQENQDQQDQDGEQNEENNEQQDQQQQNSEDQGDQQQQDQQQQQQEREDPTQLSEEEAQRILQALENEEEQLLRQVQKMKTRPRRVEKDW